MSYSVTTTDEQIDYSFLLITHMVCADQQIHNKELKYLHKLEEQTNVGKRTKEEKEKIFIQDKNLITVEVVAQKVLSEKRNWSMGQILLMAHIDGFYSSLEHQMVEQVGQIWGWSTEKIHEFIKYAQSHNPIEAIQEDTTSKGSFWDSPDYKAAIERCSEIARQDFKFTESALEAAKTILENLKINIDIELNRLDIEHKTSENSRAQTAQEVLKQLEETKKSLELEIIKKIQEIGESLNAKQRALNYFSIAFIGKTKAGKSTLHAIMTGEEWDSIGVGKQRTTRLNRVYEWENIRIIDTPGIGAPGGQTDEEIAQSVINEADVICYVVTNDSIQETEFGFLRLLKENAKSLIVLLNVHKIFRDSRRGSYELDKFLKNPDKLFALDGASGLKGHIERIRRYAQQHYGNDYFDIIPIMLLAAQLSSETEHKDNQEQMFQASRIQNFFDEIRQAIVNYGEIRRSQTLLGCTAVELEKPYQWVKLQAETFKTSTGRLQNKRQNIDKQITQAANDARNSLKNEIESIFKDALNAIPSFAEAHWKCSESTMKSVWEQELKKVRFEERLNTAYKETVNNFGKEVQDSLEEVGRELQLIAKLGNFSFSFNGQDTSDERNFFRIGGGILGLAGVVMAFIPPLAGIGLIVGIVGGVISLIGGFFKSKQEKRREAVENISKDYCEGVDEKDDFLVKISRFQTFTDELNAFTKRRSSLAKFDTPIRIALGYVNDAQLTLTRDSNKDSVFFELLNRLSRKIYQERDRLRTKVRGIALRLSAAIANEGTTLASAVGIKDIEALGKQAENNVEKLCEKAGDEMEEAVKSAVVSLQEEIKEVFASDLAQAFIARLELKQKVSARNVDAGVDFERFRKQVDGFKQLGEQLSQSLLKSAIKPGATQDVFLRAENVAGSELHKSIYGIGKFLGFKFQPYGAVNIAKGIGNVAKVLGPIVAIAALAGDIHAKEQEEKQDKAIADARREITSQFIAMGKDLESQVETQLREVEAQVYGEIETKISEDRQQEEDAIADSNRWFKQLVEIRKDFDSILQYLS